jgi:hypothetical protein
VAVSPSGRVLVAYSAPLRGTAADPAKVVAPQMTVWSGSVGGHLAGPVAIGARAKETNVSAAFDGRGRGYVMWQGNGHHNSPQLASIAPGAKRFSAVVDLDPHRNEYAEPVLAADSSAGGAVVAWTRGAPYPLTTASIDGNGRVAAHREVGGDPVAHVLLRGGVAAVASILDGSVVKFAVRPRGSTRFGTLGTVSRRPLYAATDMLSIDPDGRARITCDLDESAKRPPRLVTLLSPAS